jgi:hypothetical protein
MWWVMMCCYGWEGHRYFEAAAAVAGLCGLCCCHGRRLACCT